MNVNQRFMAQVRRDSSDHWRWTGSRTPTGYGRFSIGGWKRAHRAAWLLFRGPIPAGHDVHHVCGVTDCVNPEHLEVVTPIEHHAVRHGVGTRQRITVCKYGHPMEGENVGWRTWKNGYRERFCRECRRVHNSIVNAKRKARAAQSP